MTGKRRKAAARREWRVWAGLGAGALILLVIFVLLPLDGEERASKMDEAAQVALGRGLYAEHCASCHGANLEGQPNWRRRLPTGYLPAPPQDATGHSWHHPDQTLFEITKRGMKALAPPGTKVSMPGFAQVMTDDEIRAVLAFIKSRWPADIRARQAEITRRAGK